MGRYYNPALDLRTKGRVMRSGSYADLIKQLYEGECLIGLFDRGLFFNAPVLYDEDEYNTFMQQYNEGQLLSYEFYAVLLTDSHIN